jgi:hypothetical protein
MFAFMVAVVALFVAAVVDPRVDRADDFDDLSSTTDEIALPV